MRANHNSLFQFADYGAGPFTVSGFVATRWRMDRTGTAGVVTVAPGTTPSTASIDKDLRTQPCLDITVDAAFNPATDTVAIRQRLDRGEKFAHKIGRWAVIAFGPLGGSFQIGPIGKTGASKTLYTLGPDIPVMEWVDDFFEPPSTAYQLLKAFSAPADIATSTYKLAVAQLDVRRDGSRLPDPLDLAVAFGVDRHECARMLWPCPRGIPCQSTTTNQVVVPIWTPYAMRAVPGIVAGASSVDFMQQTNGSVFTSAAPAPSLPTAHTRGGRAILAAFTSPSALGSGVHGQIDTDRAFLLEAELG